MKKHETVGSMSKQGTVERQGRAPSAVRRRLLTAGGSGLLLAAGGCSDFWRDDVIVLDDLDDGAEVRLWMGQRLELRLAIDPADGQVTFLRSRIRPEMEYLSGPVHMDRDWRRHDRGLPAEVWVFRARYVGHTTIRMEYAKSHSAPTTRVLTYRVNVY
ncbi:MAG: hypothetical protein Q4A16_05615 [Lautropia sp.]|nr:hypothetical protein [Lautropia sp.]